MVTGLTIETKGKPKLDLASGLAPHSQLPSVTSIRLKVIERTSVHDVGLI